MTREAILHRSSATAARSSIDSQSRRSAGVPDSKRVRSSTLEMSSDISRARASMVRASAVASALVERRPMLRERAARARHHRQRRAQVVRDRCQQRVAQALALRRDARRLGHRREPLAFEREADLSGEGFQQVKLFGQQHQTAVVRQDREHTQQAPRRRPTADRARVLRAACRNRTPRAGRDPAPTAQRPGRYRDRIPHRASRGANAAFLQRRAATRPPRIEIPPRHA